MYLLYADVSGTAELQDNSKHYVLVGVCMHEGTWFGLNRRIQNLKNRYCQPGRTFELHAKQFAGTINEQDKIPNFSDMSWTNRRDSVQQYRQARLDAAANSEERAKLKKKYRNSEPFIHLDRRERSQLLEDALDLVSDHNGIRLFGEAISKAHPGVVSGEIDQVKQAFEQVVVRFDTYLQVRHRWKLQGSSRASSDNGLLILDQDYSTEPVIAQQFDRLRRDGHTWGQLRHVIDIPFSASSEQLGGLQAADICAYAVRRYLDQGAAVGSHEERNFQRIFHRFDQDNMGKLHGLRHYTPAGSCGCLICRQRGHAPAPTPAPAE
jgi:hypothetical protein